MASLDQLASIDLRNHWIAEQYGSLVCIKKDWRIVRICKKIASFFTGVDYYQHINRDRVLSVIVQHAKAEKDSKRVDGYIDVAARIGREYEGRTRILEAHPEMVASFDQSSGVYRIPQDGTALAPLSMREQAANGTLSSLLTAVFGQVAPGWSVSKDDPRYMILLQALKSQTSYPHDAKGNYWINSICRHTIKACIPPNRLKSVTGPWRKLVLPQTNFQTALGALPMPCQVVYVNEKDAVKQNAHNQVEVIIEDQQARITSDGTVALPNGRDLDLSGILDNTVNVTTINLNTDYVPFQ